MRPVAALFVRPDSVYKTLSAVDAWDIERDALRWPGGVPIVAHPPCRAWGGLRHFAKPRPGERDLALWAVDQVRRWGGVLEHPAASMLWPVAGLPAPGERDVHGGWTLVIDQDWWGHRAEKRTRLYIVGVQPRDIPAIPLRLDEPTHVIAPCRRLRAGMSGYRPIVSKPEREHTPFDLAHWLVDLARRVSVGGLSCSPLQTPL